MLDPQVAVWRFKVKINDPGTEMTHTLFEGDEAFPDADGDGVGVGLVPLLVTAGIKVVAFVLSDESDTLGTSEMVGAGEPGLGVPGGLCAGINWGTVCCCALLAGGIYAFAPRITPAYLTVLMKSPCRKGIEKTNDELVLFVGTTIINHQVSFFGNMRVSRSRLWKKSSFYETQQRREKA